MCSGIKILCKDGSVLLARTMEFAKKLAYTTHISDDIIAIKGNDMFIDGLNKHGLCVMTFYFPHYDEYAHYKDNMLNLDSWQFTEFLLINCASVEDVKKKSKKVNILHNIYKPWGFTPPFHWFVADKHGKCVTIECVKGVVTVYDNEVGVNTNSPTFPEHLMTLQNYPQFSPYNVPGKDYSEGTGFLGLPGDFTSISRFVRLNLFNKTHTPPVDSADGVNTAFHILNNFDIIKGYTIDPKTGSKEYTQYTTVYDLSGFEGWVKTYGNQNIRNFTDMPEHWRDSDDTIEHFSFPTPKQNPAIYAVLTILFVFIVIAGLVAVYRYRNSVTSSAISPAVTS